MATENKYGLHVPQIPDDEPVILFRAQDITTPAVLAAYATICTGVKASQPFVDHVNAMRNNFLVWQRRNPDKVKVPD